MVLWSAEHLWDGYQSDGLQGAAFEDLMGESPRQKEEEGPWWWHHLAESTRGAIWLESSEKAGISISFLLAVPGKNSRRQWVQPLSWLPTLDSCWVDSKLSCCCHPPLLPAQSNGRIHHVLVPVPTRSLHRYFFQDFPRPNTALGTREIADKTQGLGGGRWRRKMINKQTVSQWKMLCRDLKW